MIHVFYTFCSNNPLKERNCNIIFCRVYIPLTRLPVLKFLLLFDRSLTVLPCFNKVRQSSFDQIKQ